jgi:hypothetical protein
VALGATAGRLVAIVTRHALVAAAGGIGVGLVVAWHATTILQHFLFGVEHRESIVFAAAGVLALLITAVSALVPASQVRWLQPAAVLRSE